MNAILKIVEQVAMDKFINNKSSMGGFVRKSKIMTPFFVVSGLMVVISLAFTQYAAFLWLKTLYQPEVAAMATAGLAFAVALCSTLLGYLILSLRRKKVEQKKDEVSDVVKTTLELLQKEVNDNVHSNPKMTVLTAALAGYAAGNYQ